MNKQIEQISNKIKDSLDNLLNDKNKIADKIEIEVSELFGNSENLREIKLTLLEKDFDLSYYSLKEYLAKLKIINKILVNSETTKFIIKLEKFLFNFIEYREIWKIIDWKYYYDIFANEIHLFSSRKALITKIPINKGYLASLKKEINEISKKQFETKFQKTIFSLKNEVAVIKKTLDFEILIKKIKSDAFKSFTDSLKYEWNTLIEQDDLTQAQLSILGFIIRTSIETSLKKHPQLSNTTNKTVGNLFNELQQKDIFDDKKEEIKQKLEPLNKLVHNEDNQITKENIIAIKNYFSDLLLNQDINFPI